MSQRSCPAVPDYAAVVDYLLKLGGGSVTLSGCQICFAANISRIQTGDIGDKYNLPVLQWRQRTLQHVDGTAWILAIQRQLRMNGRQPPRLDEGVNRETLIQVLRQGFALCRVPAHGIGQRGFDPDALACRGELHSRSRRLT